MNPWLRAGLIAVIFYWACSRSMFFGAMMPGWAPNLDKVIRANAEKLKHHRDGVFFRLFIEWAIGGAAIIAISIAWR